MYLGQVIRGLLRISEQHRAVRTVFEDDWFQRIIRILAPILEVRFSQCGITALGHIMDAAFTLCEAETEGQFIDVLKLLKPKCAWTAGNWAFEPTPKHWSEVQNTSKDIAQLREYLFFALNQELASRRLKGDAA